jgi:anti-sigma factor RsiW
MKHGFSQQDWFEYTCGDLDAPRTAALESHLSACAECRDYARELEAMDQVFAQTAAQLRNSIPVLPETILSAYREVTAGSDSQRAIWLRLFLSKVCGKHTAGRVIEKAANAASAQSMEMMTPNQWHLFVASLSTMVGELCGQPAARLLQTIGYAHV